jgi:hypothetical protein
MIEIEHGTYAGAQQCEPCCEPCKRAKREYMQAWRRRRRAGTTERIGMKMPYERSGLGWPRDAPNAK